ncbi:MAG TPA: SDR family oxidoreductase [Ornithinibacter sp.]|nr:SDR family oxidoreductase [Ornithinibacter sp.]
MRVAGAHVLLTGATGDIGRRLAVHLSRAGADVTVVARGRDALDDVAREVGGRAVACDLTERQSLRSLVDRVEGGHRPVDILVNNAAMEVAAHLADLGADDLDQLVRLNLLAPAELCRQVLPGMLRRQHGHLVNISSLAGVATFPGLAAYGATKAGLTHLTSGLRADLRGGPVGTLAVELGPVSSEMMGRIREHRPSAAAFDRMLRARLLTMLDPDAVARRVVAAVEDGRHHLRMPRRAAPVAAVTQAPRMVVRTVLTGIPGGHHPARTTATPAAGPAATP